MPNVDDVGKLFESVPGFVTVPNPGLRPEYAWNLEAGAEYEVPGILRVECHAFRTRLEDAIVRRPFSFNGRDSMLFAGVMSRVEALQNASLAKVWGLQLSSRWKLSKGLTWILHANWIRGELCAQVREASTEPWESKVTPAHIAALVDLLAAGTVSVPAAKEVLAGMIETGDEPAAVVEAKGLAQMDESDLAGVIAAIVESNPDQAQQLRDGKDKVMGFFVGQAMKQTGGRADPQAVQKLVRELVLGS